MTTKTVRHDVLGPWSLATSQDFWEGFAPAALRGQRLGTLTTVFRVDADWSVAELTLIQQDTVADVTVTGEGDLEAAVAQAMQFLALDVDAREWPEIGHRDEVIAEAQHELPGLRPCGFHSAYEAAAWSVLSQRVRMTQAAHLRQRLIAEHGDDGAFPSPETVLRLDLDLPGRKAEYLHAIAAAALDGVLDTAELRAMTPDEAMTRVQSITGVGPFAAELIVLRGANSPDAIPTHERRLEAAVAERYGTERSLTEVAEAWRPFRTWASVYLRALAENRAVS
ncbi:MAG: DNA-3-methyladenine glycosylase 2 family protein [Actinomycetota bacterium]|nr:DNA-3-methyladenine glycosylase 2 family protein [Actinomycetota bacterium]